MRFQRACGSAFALGPMGESPFRKPLVAEPEALAIVGENLERRATSVAESKERAGFKSGDLITEFNGQPVASWRDLARLSTAAASAAAVVTVQRDQQSVGLTIGPLGEEDGKPSSISMQLTVATK